MKTVLQLPEDAPWFYAEDHAPGHYHDNCSVTKEKNLCSVRKEYL